MKNPGHLSIACAVAAALLGMYSNSHEVTEAYRLVNGLVGIAAIVCAVVWWRSRAHGNRVSRG